MASGVFLFLALCASLFCLTSARTTNIIVNTSWQPRATFDGGDITGDGDPIADCLTQDAVIREAFADALALAANARDVIDDNFRRPWHRDFFEDLFRDQTSVFSRSYVANIYDGIATNNGLPDEVIFHCGDGWIGAMYRRLSAYGLAPRKIPTCRPGDAAMTDSIKSGEFPPNAFSEFGPQGAFRSGIHITLCPEFFNDRSLGQLLPVVDGLAIDSQDNQAWTMLHELMHASDRSIKDGGYGYKGCIDIANGGHPTIDALKNADTFALFAMAVTRVQDMDLWDWTRGYAVPP